MLDSKLVATVAATEPLLGYYLMRSRIVHDPNSHSEASIDVEDGQLVLLINPQLFAEHTESVQTGIILHEYLHALLLHCGSRALDTKEQAWVANIAQDMAINPEILKHYGLPKDAVLPGSGGYNLPEFRSSEFYFNKLSEDLDRFTQTFGQPPARLPQLAECLADLTAEFNAAGYGNGGGFLHKTQTLLMTVDRATRRLTWRSELRRFARSAKAAQLVSGGRRYSRRLGMPYPGKRYQGQPHVPVVLDTSASMSESLADVVAEIAGLSNLCDLRLYQCDSRLQSVQKLVGDSVEVRGFGGTDLQPALDRCKADKCKRVLIVSDGKFERPLNLHGMRATWLDVGTETKLRGR